MIGSLYEKYVLPKLLDCCCSTKPVTYQRNKIVPLAKGTVLEVGIGSGLNIPFYDSSSVDKVIGLDPSEELNQIAEKNAEKSELEIEFLINEAEEIHLPNKSVDTVLVTYKHDHSADTINHFRHSNAEWIVSVGMVSEGTDIPRLQVCCHLSSVKTELYFRQVLGRILRIDQGNNLDRPQQYLKPFLFHLLWLVRLLFS